MILQGTCDNFRSRSRTTIDQHDHRLAINQIAGAGIIAAALLLIAGPWGYDLAFFQEGIGDGNCLIQQTAGIITQIEDIADNVTGCLFLDPLNGLFQA